MLEGLDQSKKSSNFPMVCSDVKNDCVQDRDQVGLIRDKHRFGGHLILKTTSLQMLTKVKEELESKVKLV